MEFLLINQVESLPQDIFAHENFLAIEQKHHQKKISDKDMYKLLEKTFLHHNEMKSTTYFKWTENLSNFYSKTNEDGHHIPMFKYWFDKKHKLRIDIPEHFEKPYGYTWNDHPVLFYPDKIRGQVTMVLKLTNKSTPADIRYIMPRMRVFTKQF